MADCEKLIKCPFFNGRMAGQPATAELYKKKYCQGDNSGCARYMIVQAGLTMPDDLYPNMTDRAQQMIAASKQ